MTESHELTKLPVSYQNFYKKHFNSIRTRVTRGKIKDVYHFLIKDTYDQKMAKRHFMEIKDDQKGNFKMNLAFGFILRNLETGELRFFHPSQNNTILDVPVRISDQNDVTDIADKLDQDDIFSYIDAQRPSTKWRAAKLVCLRVDVYKIL